MKRRALLLMRNCGGFAFARAMSSKMARILMYHNFSGPYENDAYGVSSTAVREQFSYLRRYFHVVPLIQIEERLRSGASFDPLTVALTIDDGRRNCYEFLFPLLKEFRIPATFFVVSSFIRREDWIWTDKVLWLSEQPTRPRELSPGEIEASFARLNRLRPEVRTAFIAGVAERMGVSIPGEAPPKYAPCSWNELREMADSGLVEIGSHTVSHPILASVTDEESWNELTVSRAQIEEGLGKQVVSFCFPNGKPGDCRRRQMQQVKEAGYLGAVMANCGMATNRTDPYALPRIGVSGHSDHLSFSKNLDGIEYYQAKLQGRSA